MKTISQVFARNVRAEAKAQGIKIGELERSCGMQAGYLSRIIGLGHEMQLGVAYNMARKVGVTVDELCLEEHGIRLEKKLRLEEIARLQEKIDEISKGMPYGEWYMLP